MNIVEFAGHRHSNIRVSKDSRNGIGLAYLRRFNLTFKLGDRLLFLAPREKFRDPATEPELGLGVLRRENTTVVAYLEVAGRAEKCGLKVGDKLIAVSGQTIEDQPLAEIRWRTLSGVLEKGSVSLTIERNGEEHILDLR